LGSARPLHLHDQRFQVLAEPPKAISNEPWVAACKSEPPRLCVRSQLDRLLPLCPITSRYNVIPAGYDKRRRADSSPEILVDQADRRMRSLLTRLDLRNTRSAHQSARKSLGGRQIRCVPVPFTLTVAARPVTKTLVGPSKVQRIDGGYVIAYEMNKTSSCLPRLQLDPRITLNSRTYKSQE